MRVLLVLALSVLLLACVESGNEYQGELVSDSRPTPPVDLPDSGTDAVCSAEIDRFNSGLWAPVLAPSCLQCHQAGGSAATSGLVLKPASASNYLQDNLNTINRYVSGVGAVTLEAKPLAETVHGGGRVLARDSAAHQALMNWLAGPVQYCEGGVITPSAFWDGSEQMDAPATLRKAALLFAGRLPTNTELSTVAAGGDAALRTALLNLMTGEHFSRFIMESANDRLLTSKYANGRTPALDLIYEGGRFPYIESRLAPLQQAVNNASSDEEREAASQAFGFAWQQTNLALATEPLQLINYVVTRDRPYTEVLTADYLMVNPFSNDVYNTGINFSDRNNPDDWRPARIINGYVHGAIPHAGLLTSQMFLARYPSTATNRNRARARWAYYFFLNVDIEGMVARSMDPDDLADTNNPTLNNASCAVCHELMDPVAGAFQNFGDNGHYRDAWDGDDALPDTYKASELYRNGDLWYRDMRLPGFAGQNIPADAATQRNSLQWLAQRMVADERFASGTVAFWWPAVFGSEPVLQPTEPSDADYAQKLAVYTEQQRLIGELASSFRSSNYHLKTLLADMAMTPVFRATASDNAQYYADMGAGQLHTAEQLNRKIRALTGQRWHHTWDAQQDLLANEFYGLFGGIDSDTVVKRADSLNTLMYAVAGRMSHEMVCRAVINEFEQPRASRTLFTLVDMTDTPANASAAVRAQINALIARLWGDPLTDLSVEQNSAYNLFQEVWADRVANAPSTWLYHNDTQNDAEDEFCLLEWDNESALRQDPNHTLRSWMAVLTYLLSDFRLLYE